MDNGSDGPTDPLVHPAFCPWHCGIVVRDGRIVELVPKGGQPTTTARFFEAGDHVVLPGLINTHHHSTRR